MVQTFILRSTDDNQETVRTEPFDELRRALVEVRTVTIRLTGQEEARHYRFPSLEGGDEGEGALPLSRWNRSWVIRLVMFITAPLTVRSACVSDGAYRAELTGR